MAHQMRLLTFKRNNESSGCQAEMRESCRTGVRESCWAAGGAIVKAQQKSLEKKKTLSHRFVELQGWKGP